MEPPLRYEPLEMPRAWRMFCVGCAGVRRHEGARVYSLDEKTDERISEWLELSCADCGRVTRLEERDEILLAASPEVHALYDLDVRWEGDVVGGRIERMAVPRDPSEMRIDDPSTRAAYTRWVFESLPSNHKVPRFPALERPFVMKWLPSLVTLGVMIGYGRVHAHVSQPAGTLVFLALLVLCLAWLGGVGVVLRRSRREFDLYTEGLYRLAARQLVLSDPSVDEIRESARGLDRGWWTGDRFSAGHLRRWIDEQDCSLAQWYRAALALQETERRS